VQQFVFVAEVENPGEPDLFKMFGGYVYNPLTMTRILGARMPGASPEMIDRAFFDDRDVVPPYEEQPWHVSPVHEARLGESMGWAMSATSLPELDADRALAKGEPCGPLHGVPFTTKINTDHAGCATSNGVAAYADLIARADSPSIANLRKAGAIAIGRTNAPEFSWRWFTDNELHGETVNPWHRGRTCGGSTRHCCGRFLSRRGGIERRGCVHCPLPLCMPRGGIRSGLQWVTRRTHARHAPWRSGIDTSRRRLLTGCRRRDCSDRQSRFPSIRG